MQNFQKLVYPKWLRKKVESGVIVGIRPELSRDQHEGNLMMEVFTKPVIKSHSVAVLEMVIAYNGMKNKGPAHQASCFRHTGDDHDQIEVGFEAYPHKIGDELVIIDDQQSET